MRVGLLSVLLIVLLIVSSSCSPSATNSSAATTPPVSSSFDIGEAQRDIENGKLTFEIRGLANEAQEKSYGGKSYEHTAVVIPAGDSKYVKENFFLIYSVRRLSGGDPENARRNDDIAAVFVHNGMGRLTVSGGYKGKDEKWEPEKIEVRPEVVFVGTPVVGTAVHE